MKSCQNIISLRRNVFLALCMFVTLMLLNACVTQQAVKDIVDASNARMLVAQLPGETLPSGAVDGSPDAEWMALSARIDEFIETYPNQTTMVNAMRIRQAMLLMAYEQYNLARASFGQVNSSELTTARDRALYNSRDALLWWFELDKTGGMSAAQFEKGDDALKKLQIEVDRLQGSPGIRDYLAEIRVWIALYCGRKTTSTDRAKAYVENGINHYAQIFTAEDLAAMKRQATPAEFQDAPQAVRRRLRAKTVIKYAREVIQRQGIQPSISSPEFAALLSQ